MDQVLAQNALIQAIHRYAHALDELDKDGMLAPFPTDRTLTYDLSSYFGGEVQEMHAEELYALASGTLGGFTATQHLLGAPAVTFHDHRVSKATIKVQVFASHSIEAESGIESVVARGYWLVESEKEGAEWVFRRFASVKTMPMSNVELYKKAAERVKQGFGRVATKR